MKTEYRVIFTAVFDTDAERNKMYVFLKNKVPEMKGAIACTRANITRDESVVNEPSVTEQVI